LLRDKGRKIGEKEGEGEQFTFFPEVQLGSVDSTGI
jgi:hypothetical protein